MGTEAVKAFIEMLPAWVQASMTVASTMLPALGMALLMKSLWSKENCPYYFLGFALGAFFFYRNVTGVSIAEGAATVSASSVKILSLVQISFIGAVIAALIIFAGLRRIKDQAAKPAADTTLDESEDFFND